MNIAVCNELIIYASDFTLKFCERDKIVLLPSAEQNVPRIRFDADKWLENSDLVHKSLSFNVNMTDGDSAKM